MSFWRRPRPEPVEVHPSPPAVLWVIQTPNGIGWVWPCVDRWHPGTGDRIWHWRGTIWHNQIPGMMEGHYEHDWAAMNAVSSMLGGTPDDWEAR